MNILRGVLVTEVMTSNVTQGSLQCRVHLYATGEKMTVLINIITILWFSPSLLWLEIQLINLNNLLLMVS